MGNFFEEGNLDQLSSSLTLHIKKKKVFLNNVTIGKLNEIRDNKYSKGCLDYSNRDC